MPSLPQTRNAVAASFALAGFTFATLVSRLPDVRGGLDLDNAALGLLLFAIALGSIVAMPSAGWAIDRTSAAAVVRLGACLVAGGLVVAMLGAASGTVAVTAVGFLSHGAGTGLWDVAMNVEGAEVERRLGRTIMPRFHAAWSAGSIAGAALGIPMAALHVPLLLHVGPAVAAALLLAWRGAGSFLPTERLVGDAAEASTGPAGRSAWLEPRTLAIGAMVLSFALVEGTANDWLSLALIDGYDVRHWVGVAGFSLFVCAMTTGRLVGPVLLDRFGRAAVLWGCAAATTVGVLLVVLGGAVAPETPVAPVAAVAVGIVVWGLGASLGFPVGMSAAADDPARAARRVSVVSTIGYGAFLAGPPALGLLADHVGTLRALLVLAALMLPASLTVLAARPARDREGAAPAAV
ncbi:MFS transporter [Nocardioides sp. GY 10113]|uniref:MFS transporter n=1 Tax=Nocardioides sp. GY 10113 TaxID=2569761 RepID=UPI0010A81353|nr:MFS transporter [Nocardioides sp. GY 10113]TIC89043.1 MFS transporter [Nocardioides sp. GY 10113]